MCAHDVTIFTNSRFYSLHRDYTGIVFKDLHSTLFQKSAFSYSGSLEIRAATYISKMYLYVQYKSLQLYTIVISKIFAQFLNNIVLCFQNYSNMMWDLKTDYFEH